MGRSREFDLERALEVATVLFWRQGYDATSVSDLTAAIGITPPSFYFAFESKEGIFRRVVERYQAVQARVVGAALAADSTEELAQRLLYGFAALFTDPRNVPGCLVLNNSLPVTESHPFRKWFSDQRNGLRRRLRARLRELSGDAAGECDAEALARLLVALIWGMAIEAQSGASRRGLRRMVDAFLRMYLTGRSVRPRGC